MRNNKDNTNKTYSLTAENIDVFSEELFSLIIEKKLDRQIAVKARLTAEILLTDWLARLPENSEFHAEVKSILGRTHILLKAKGDMLSDTIQSSDDDFYKSMLVNMEAVYNQRYVDGYNVFDIKLPRPQLGSVGKVVAAIISAVLLGELMLFLLPQDVLSVVNERFVAPLFNVIMRMLGATASFMIFTSIVVSISFMQNIYTLKTLGWGLFKQHFKLMNIFVLMSAAFCIVCFPVLKLDGGVDGTVFFGLFDMLLDIVPKNFIAPFTDGNTLQIVFLAVLFGVVILILDSEVAPIRTAVVSLNRIFQYIMIGICELMPIIVFLSFLQLVITNSVVLALRIWKVLAVEAFIIAVIWFVYMWQIKRCSGKTYAAVMKEFLPMSVLALSSSSSIACLKMEEELLEKNYNVDRSLVDFGLPIGLILSKPGFAVHFIVLVFGCSAACGQTVNLGQALTLVLTSAILSLALPPVPGGMIAFLSVLFAQYNLPNEMLCIMIAVNFIADMMQTLVHVVGNPTQIIVLDAATGKNTRENHKTAN